MDTDRGTDNAKIAQVKTTCKVSICVNTGMVSRTDMGLIFLSHHVAIEIVSVPKKDGISLKMTSNITYFSCVSQAFKN